ncbi:unnamed protein product [Macrosiphum euphorbiae]|uniref:Uncharacterized protein n=1 Tax=Macrosiphum euphorbiae TaxID=13131 RepID=A0AAV0XTM4_9HEMI|nr:unnamed protein product [Macrosiphum euphorbiae]
MASQNETLSQPSLVAPHNLIPSKPKSKCPGCGKDYVSLNGHLAKASGPCAAIRAQRLIDSTPAASGSSSSNPLNASLAPIRNIQAINPQPVAVVADLSKNLIQEADSFANQFESYIVLNPNESSINEFDKLVAKFSTFLFEANNRLPGPQIQLLHSTESASKVTAMSWIANTENHQTRNAQQNAKPKEPVINIITTWHNGSTPTKGERWQTAF